MQGDDVRFPQQGFLVDKGHAFDLFGRAVPCQHLAAKGIRQLGDTLPDVTHADDADSLTANLASGHEPLAVALACNRIVFKHFTIDINHHGDGQLSYGLGAVACRVLHDDAATLAFLHVDVIQARESDGEHLQVGTGIEEVLTQRNVALDDDFRTFGAAFQLVEILVAVGIDDHLMASLLQAFAGGFNLLDLQAQRLQKDDFHFAAIISISTKAFLGSSFTAKAARAG